MSTAERSSSHPCCSRLSPPGCGASLHHSPGTGAAVGCKTQLGALLLFLAALHGGLGAADLQAAWAPRPEPNGVASALLTSGPFRWTRNPLYLGLADLLACFGVLLDSAWTLCLTRSGPAAGPARHRQGGKAPAAQSGRHTRAIPGGFAAGLTRHSGFPDGQRRPAGRAQIPMGTGTFSSPRSLRIKAFGRIECRLDCRGPVMDLPPDVPRCAPGCPSAVRFLGIQVESMVSS